MTTAKSAAADMSVDEWLDRGDGSGGKFLKIDWDADKEYRVWLHPKAPIGARWQHTFKRISSDGKKVRMLRFNSMERALVLDKQNFRGDDGAREYPPEVCPFSLTMEWVHEQIDAGTIKWTDEIFAFKPSDDDDEVIHAGGWLGMFQDRDLTKEQKAEIRKAGCRIDEAYRENCKAEEQIVFIVIDNADPSKGPIIAPVKRALGRAFQKAVKNRRKAMTTEPEKADPLKYPVCWMWSVDDSGDFREYLVAPTDNPLTDEIKAAFEQEVPDVSKMFAQSNVAELRDLFVKHWVHEVVPPWDELFAAGLEAVKGTSAAELPQDFKHGANAEDDSESEPVKPSPATGQVARPAPTPAPAAPAAKPAEPAPVVTAAVTTPAAPAPATLPPVAENESECDHCHSGIPDELFTAAGETGLVVCPHCGTKYKLDQPSGEFRPVDETPAAPAAPAEPAIRASRRTASSKK